MTGSPLVTSQCFHHARRLVTLLGIHFPSIVFSYIFISFCPHSLFREQQEQKVDKTAFLIVWLTLLIELFDP